MSLLDDIWKGKGAAEIWFGKGGHAVPKEKSQSRADVCLTLSDGHPCPNNQKGYVTTRIIAGVLKRLLSYKNRMNLKVDGEKHLHHCHVCSCVLKLKVHEPIELIEESTTPEEFEMLPPGCWIKREILEKQ